MSKSGSNSSSDDDGLTVISNVISDGVNLTVVVPPDSNDFIVTAKVDGQQVSANYSTTINQDGTSTFKRTKQQFNQEKNLIPLVESINNQSKAYPRLQKALNAHGGLCDIMCNHIVMEDLISEKNKASTPYKMPNIAKKSGTNDEFRNLGPNTLKNLQNDKAFALPELSAHEKAILDKLEEDVAPLHFLKQVTIFQIMKAAIFAKIPHNHLSSDDQHQLNSATKNLYENFAKETYIDLLDDALKKTDSLHAEEKALLEQQQSLEKLKNQTHLFDGTPITDEKDIALKAQLEKEKEHVIELKKEEITTLRVQIEGIKNLVAGSTGEMNKLLSTAVDNIEPDKYAKFMVYEKDGLDFSGHTMLIRNNGNGKYSFFDPDKGLTSNVDKAELLLILDKAFLECGRPNIAVVNVHKMLPKQEQKQEQEQKKESTNEKTHAYNPLLIAKSVVSQYNNRKELRGYFSSFKEGAKSDSPDVSQAEKGKKRM